MTGLKKIKIRDVIELCKCLLTRDELLACGESMADAQNEANRLRDEMESRVKEYKASIAREEARAEHLGTIIRAKYEQRDTECTEVTNYTDGVIYVRRNDTGELVKNRRMTTDEKQLPLSDQLTERECDDTGWPVVEPGGEERLATEAD